MSGVRICTSSGPAIIVNHGGMQGLVEIVLGGGDVIVKLMRDGPPVGVDDAQGGIAGRHIRDDQADTAQIRTRSKGFSFSSFSGKWNRYAWVFRLFPL